MAASHAESRWLQRHWAPAQLRRGPLSATLTSEGAELVISGLTPKECERWRKSAATQLKKLVVEDLGDWDAGGLLLSIQDSRWGPNSVKGEGWTRLRALEKELTVLVLFLENGHVQIRLGPLRELLGGWPSRLLPRH